jgi:hypothetical protein
MSDAPVERHHREWALRAMCERPDPGAVVEGEEPLDSKDLEDAYHWLDTGDFPEEAVKDANDADLEVLKVAVSISQAFADFEFEIRTETDAALKESKDHAQALDANWDRFCRISLDEIRSALDLDHTAAVPDMVSKIRQLRGVTPS